MESFETQQYNTYIGKRFYQRGNKETFFTFGSIHETFLCHIIDRELSTINYYLISVLKKIRDRDWILLEE
jgi:hypothetical protein